MHPIGPATTAPPRLPDAQPPGPLDGIGDWFGRAVDKLEELAKSLIERVEGETGGMPENERIARKLVEAGGTADKKDVDLVVAELAKMPVTALRQMEAAGTKVVACRGSVTDHATELRGVQPRGWPPGATWDQVPGAYMPDRNQVVVAVIGHGTPAGAHVPATGEGHGSANLVIHEAAHAVDATIGASRNSASPAFNEARNKDIGAVSDYERQPGVAGQSETYAESAARYYGGSNGSAKTPALNAYWRDNPLGGR